MPGTGIYQIIRAFLLSLLILLPATTVSMGQDVFRSVENGDPGTRVFAGIPPASNSIDGDYQKFSIEMRELDDSGIPMIVAKGTRTRFEPSMAGYRESYSFEIHFSIYGGPVSGWGVLYSDVLDTDTETGEWILNGKFKLDWTFSGLYSGGLFGEFTDGQLTGSFQGNLGSEPQIGTATGDWDATVDGTLGTIDGSLEWTLNFTSGLLDYPSYIPFGLTFEPFPEVNSLIVAFNPTEIGVYEEGLYAANMSILALDSMLLPVPYRKLNLGYLYEGQLKSFSIGSGDSIVTNGSGYASTNLLLDIDDLQNLPEKITVLVADDLDDQVTQDAELPIQLTTLEVDITSPSSEATLDEDEVWISGIVDADDLSSVNLSISVENPVEGKAGEPGSLEYPAAVDLSADGTFQFPVTLLTPNAWYKVVVTAEDDLGNLHADQTLFYYEPVVVLEIDSVDYPDQSLEEEEFTVTITVSYRVFEEDTLTVELTVGDEYDTYTFEVYPPSNPTARDDASNQVITEVIEFPWTLPADTVHETASVEVQVKAKLNKNGTTAQSFSGFMNVGAVSFGDDCQLYVRLPFPTTLDTHALTLNLTRDDLTRLASERTIHPDWHKNYNGFEATVKCISHSSNLELEVGSVDLTLDGPIYDHWSINTSGDTDWKTLPHTFETKKILTEWSYPKDLIVGEYQFIMKYVVRDKDTEKTSKGQRSFKFWVKNLKVKFKHTTLSSEKVSTGTNSYSNQKQNDSNGGSGNLGGSQSGNDYLNRSFDFSQPFDNSLDSASLTLDWNDSDADVDLHMVDPDGYVVGMDYLRNRIRNSIPGASYSGPDSKPETLQISNPKEGDYLITFYVREADSPVDVSLTVLPAGSLDLEINQIDSGQCPSISLDAALYNDQGDPVMGMTSSEFSLTEDDVEQDISVSSIGASASSVALLIDTSAVPHQSVKKREISIAHSIMEDFGDRHTISTLTFDENVHQLNGFADESLFLVETLESIPFSGSASVYDAVVRAAEILSGRDGKKAILVLSNGIDTASFNGLESAIKAARRTGAPVSVIQTTSFDGSDLMQLSKSTGGRFFSDLSDLSQRLADLQPLATSNYRITYTTGKPKADHKLELTVTTGGLTASDTVSLTACEQGCSCDVDGNGSVGIGDLQLLINQVLGLAPAKCDINGDGHVGIADIQIVINAILGMGCNP